MVGSSVPIEVSSASSTCAGSLLPVGEERNLITRHDDDYKREADGVSSKTSNGEERDVKEACPFAGIIQIKLCRYFSDQPSRSSNFVSVLKDTER